MDTTILATIGGLGGQLQTLAALAQAAKLAESAALNFASPELGNLNPRRVVSLTFKSDADAKSFLEALEAITRPQATLAPIDGSRFSPA